MEMVNNSEPNNSRSIFNESTIVTENVNELTNIEFNSADDVRQRMKAVITNTMPNGNEETQQTLKNEDNVFKNIRQSKGIEITEGEQNIVSNKIINKSKLNTSRPCQTTELRLNKNTMLARKRPGRPPKAGPSKKQKKESASSMYVGKLSNVVRRRYESESDGDSELS